MAFLLSGEHLPSGQHPVADFSCVEDALNQLYQQPDGFLILEQSEMEYIQCALEFHGSLKSFVVEVQELRPDGSPHHVMTQFITLPLAVEYFSQYYWGTLDYSNWEDITSELYG